MVLLNKVELNSKKFYFSSATHDEGGFCFNNKRFFMWLVTYIEKSLCFSLKSFSRDSVPTVLIFCCIGSHYDKEQELMMFHCSQGSAAFLALFLIIAMAFVRTVC